LVLQRRGEREEGGESMSIAVREVDLTTSEGATCILLLHRQHYQALDVIAACTHPVDLATDTPLLVLEHGGGNAKRRTMTAIDVLRRVETALMATTFTNSSIGVYVCVCA
jgi:hypothetical protein